MKIVNNITYCDEFSNEFTKLYNDTYQILSGYDTIDACAAAIIDFTKHVQLGKMDSFWVNFVSIHQSMEYKNTLPEIFENKAGGLLYNMIRRYGLHSIFGKFKYTCSLPLCN